MRESEQMAVFFCFFLRGCHVFFSLIDFFLLTLGFAEVGGASSLATFWNQSIFGTTTLVD